MARKISKAVSIDDIEHITDYLVRLSFARTRAAMSAKENEMSISHEREKILRLALLVEDLKKPWLKNRCQDVEQCQSELQSLIQKTLSDDALKKMRTSVRQMRLHDIDDNYRYKVAGRYSSWSTDDDQEAVVAQAEATTTRLHHGYYLTLEQNHAVDLATKGLDMKIEAFAGAGKTSTLSAIATALANKKGLYIAFNKTIADEAAQSFPSNVSCKTAHSLAYKAVGFKYKDRLTRLNGTVLMEKYLSQEIGVLEFSLAATGGLVLSVITKFCQSADNEISRDHAPWKTLKPLGSDEKYLVADHVVSLAKKAWNLMIDVDAEIPITHDVYLKVWALSKPRLRRDFILFDEAQDANALMLDLVMKQKCQKIFVGDRFQQIYSWRGAVNAMQTLKLSNECTISQSFRFGNEIANVANAILNGELDANVNLKGFEEIESRVCEVDEPDAILFRTNAFLINELIARIGKGYQVAVAGGCYETVALLRGVKDLKDGKQSSHADLSLFKSWSELVSFSETEAGTDLASIVNLARNRDLDKLITTLTKASKVSEQNADVVLSTAHKAKGREWSKVKLANDFRDSESKAYTPEETNLLYVAATRAIDKLDVSDCDAIKALFIEDSENKCQTDDDQEALFE